MFPNYGDDVKEVSYISFICNPVISVIRRAQKMKLSVSRTTLMTVLTIMLLVLSPSATTISAKKPDMKMVDTVVGSYTIDGTTVYFVSHITGIMKWIVEPTDYIEWPADSGNYIPVNGEFWVKTSSFEHDRLFWDDSHISIISSGSSSYVGTFEVVPTPPEFPWLPPYMPMPKNGLMSTYTLMKKWYLGYLGTSKYHVVVKYVNFVPQVLMEKLLPPPQPPGKVPALLTGTIDDYGLDMDGDLLYEYLVVSVEVRVRTPGIYVVVVSGLFDSSNNWIDVFGTNSIYLDRGTHFIDILLDGPKIYVSGFNPSMVYHIDLYDQNYNSLGSMQEIPLSREYSFEEFERPPASLIGVIYDEGVDTDGDGTFDYLEIGVEVEVNTAGLYEVDAWGLHDVDYNYIYVGAYESAFLDVGTQVVVLTFNGPTIYASGVNPSFVASIALWDEYFNLLGSTYDVPLSREYSYTEFDVPPASLTGVISDLGVDTDGDGLFNYLEISVQVEVSEAGTYTIEINGLLDKDYNYIAVWSSSTVDLEVGTQTVYLQPDGPTIYAQSCNPICVSWIGLYDGGWNFLGSLYNTPLSREYSYTEFDASP